MAASFGEKRSLAVAHAATTVVVERINYDSSSPMQMFKGF